MTKEAEQIFTNIYKNNGFNGKESISGSVSDTYQTRIIIKEIPLLFKDYNNNTMLDIPCSDFYWMKEEVDLKDIEYIGTDIVDELINKGLWKEETTIKFFSEGADGRRIADESMHENIIEIETVKLSSYLNKEKQIDFLKLDIEGSETEVLLESGTFLSKVKNIFIEYHSFSNQKQTLSTILSILEKNGFRYYIEHIGVKSNHPFINIRNYVGFDNQLNIFGYRV